MRYIYACEYKIDGKWQKDGECWPTLASATEFAADNIIDQGWEVRFRRIPMSSGKLVRPSLAEVRERSNERGVALKVVGNRLRLGDCE